MTPEETGRVLDAARSAHERAFARIESLERAVAGIVEASELTATDDEHDSEGATIAYERAQAIALLRQARRDLDRVVTALAHLRSGEAVVCEKCGCEIGTERLVALPIARTCIDCARSIAR